MQPTPLGATAAAASAVLLALGYLLGYQGAALIGMGGLAALGLAAMAIVRRPPVRLSREIYPARVSRGEPAAGMLTVENVSRWAGLRVDVYERFGGQDLPIPVPFLRRSARKEIGYQLPASRRGVINVGPLSWERVDPLGLLRRRRSLAGTVPLYVHPVIHPFPLGSAFRSERWDGTASDTAAEGTITFHALREYVPGDDLRQIHWRSSARAGNLMVRKNIDPSIPRTTVLLVTARAAYPDPEMFEEAVEVAASAAAAAIRERLPATLHTSDGRSMYRGGRP